VDVEIKNGDQFKFILDNGIKYLTSLRYPTFKDKYGNLNNVYDTSKINRNKTEKVR